MENNKYILSLNSARSRSLKKTEITARPQRALALKAADTAKIANRIGTAAAKLLILGKKISISNKDLRWLNRNLSVIKLLPYGKSQVAQLYQFSVTTEVRFENAKKTQLEDANYFVVAKTKTIAKGILRSRLKEIYPSVFFNTDWILVEIRVSKIKLMDTLPGVANGNDWIFD